MSINNENEFEKAMINALKDSKVIKHVNLQDVVGKFDSNVISKMLEQSSPLVFKDDTIIFEYNEEKEICPNYGVNVQLDSEWLSDKLDDVPYDVDQGGNVRKADEAEAALCCINISKVLGDDTIKEDIRTLSNHYDYTTCSIKSTAIDLEFYNYCSLLESLRSLQSRQINVIIAATKISINNIKKDTSKFLRDGIPRDLAIDLRSLETNVKTEFRKYSTGKLAPENVRSLTKLEILKLIDERDRNVNVLLQESNAGVLFRIMSLTSEYLSPMEKRKLNTESRINVIKLFEENKSLHDVLGDQSQVLEKWKKRYYKIATSSFIKEEIRKYLENSNSYKLPVKR